MPTRKARKRKRDEIQHDIVDSENEESDSPEVTTRRSKRRKISNPSPKGRGQDQSGDDTEEESPKRRVSQRLSQRRALQDLSQQKSKKSKNIKTKTSKKKKDTRSKLEADSEDEENPPSSPSSTSDQNDSEFDPDESGSKTTSPTTNRNKNRNKNRNRVHPKKPNAVSPSRTHNKNTSQRLSVARSQSERGGSQSQRRQTQPNNEEEVELKLVEHNPRVMQMYKWLDTKGKSISWINIKKELVKWVEDESDPQDGESYADLTLDIVNLMLYCGGIRTFKVNDSEELEIDSLLDHEKVALMKKLEESAQVDHEDIEPVPEGAASGSEDEEHDEEDEKAEIEPAPNTNTKTKKGKNKKKKLPRTTAERVLDFDPMLWCNGTSVQRDRFQNRYRLLLTQIIKALEEAIYKSDDFIITILLMWCQFLSRDSHLAQLRKLGCFTAFSLCEPMVKCMAKNRQQMATIQKRMDNVLEKEAQRANKSKKSRKSPSKSKDSSAVKACKENIAEFKGKIDNLEAHTKWTFDEIGAYKANDTDDSLRCMVIEHIVKWINLDPSTDSFLKRHYWQYLAYGLKDKQSAVVRRCALIQLQDLFDYQCKFHGTKSQQKKKKDPKKENKVHHDDDGNVVEEKEEDKLDETRVRVLEPFWDEIRNTVNWMLKDKDEGVVKHCVEFVNILLRGDMLGAEDGDCILNYIFDESDDIRQVAASFIFHDTFADQAVLKSHEANKQSIRGKEEDDEDEDEEMKEAEAETRIRIVDVPKLKDDVVELIQLMKDRVVDLNLRTKDMLEMETKRIEKERIERIQNLQKSRSPSKSESPTPELGPSTNHKQRRILKKNTLYRNYVQVADYIVQSMSKELTVLREWKILFEILREADDEEQRQKERNIQNKNRHDNDSENAVEEMQAKYSIDDEGQTILCHLILSCIKSVVGLLDKQVINVKAKRGRKTLKAEEENKQRALHELKECVLPHLSALLDRYQADNFKLYPIIQMIPLLPINTFDGLKQKEYLIKILNALETIFSRHDTPYIPHQRGMVLNGTKSEDELSDDSREMSEIPEITDDMNDTEREEIEGRMRQQQMKQLRRCIKLEIDDKLIDEVGRAFSYFCNGEYQYKEIAARFVFDIVTEITDEFEDIYSKIDRKLKKGHDLSTLDALRGGSGNDNNNTSGLGLMQSLYSNLHKQDALKRRMDVNPITFNEAMDSLMNNIYDDLMFDGPYFEISSVLQRLLTTEINRNITVKLNTNSPDMERLHEITQQKGSLVKVLKYYVNRMDRFIAFERREERKEQDNDGDVDIEVEEDWNGMKLSNEQMIAILDQITIALECLPLFRRFKHQSQLMDECFNNASLSDMEPVYGVENSGFNNGNGPMSAVKEKLLNIFGFVMTLPVMEDPFDPSAHHTTENLQIRFLMGFARLILMNPTYYKSFGGVVVSHLYQPQLSSNSNSKLKSKSKSKGKSKSDETRQQGIMKDVLRRVFRSNIPKYNEMLFEGIKRLMNDETYPVSIRVHTVQSACASAAMIDGLAKRRKDWEVYIKLFLEFVIGTPENVPRYFVYLHSMTSFFKKFTARDKLDVWSQFQSLSRKLPSDELRTDESAWNLYNKFRAKLKSEASKAAGARDLELDEDGLENWDQRKEADSSQSQRGANRSVNMSEMARDLQIGVQIEDDDDHKDGDNQGAGRQDGDGNEDQEVPRMAVSVSRLNVSGSQLQVEDNNTQNTTNADDRRVAVAMPQGRGRRGDGDEDEDSVESDGDKENRRVMVAVSKSKKLEAGNSDDEDVDMGEDGGSASSSSAKSKGRRARAGKWMKRKAKK